MQRLIIAKYTLIEAHKRSFILLFCVGICVCLAIAGYAASLVMIQKQAALAAFYGATVRMMSAALLGGYLILMETRNLERENAFIWLGLPVSRLSYVLQKVLTYTLITMLLTLLALMPLWWVGVDVQVVLRWALGLYCELLIVVSLCLLFSCLFRQTLISLAAFAAVYLFARSALEFYQHSSNIIEQGGGGYETSLAWIVKLSTYLVPKLEQFASASWLLHQRILEASWYAPVVQTLLFCGLLILITFDRLRRRGF